jgi:hypothetical protein
VPDERPENRPRPVPRDVTGLAFSGGGIRSAAVCLGALQALQHHRRIGAIDYLSTVSGGGYIGSGLSAAMSVAGGRAFPYGDDVADSPAVGHLRNYSNYLLPRGQSGVINLSDTAAVILRGLLANVVLVLTTLLLCVLITKIAYHDAASLGAGSFVPGLVDGVFGERTHLRGWVGASPFALTFWLLSLDALGLIVWALLRGIVSLNPGTDDTDSLALLSARYLIIGTVVVAFLDAQPGAIRLLVDAWSWLQRPETSWWGRLTGGLAGGLVSFSGVVSALSSTLGHFLKTTENATDMTTLVRRALTRIAVAVAALVLPVALWIAYLALSAWIIFEWRVPTPLAFLVPQNWWHLEFIATCGLAPVVQFFIIAFIVLAIVGAGLQANAYSLHRLYRDRLSRAFLFKTPTSKASAVTPLDGLRLTALSNAGPYHIINAAMNVESSADANQRGRNADFFMFTRRFVGSDLTGYVPTIDMQRVDRRLDLATAMAISGAAVSANMGTATVRLLSPTLALLNIRLGYWLRNPRDLVTRPSARRRLVNGFGRVLDKFYLLLEMLNLLDEKSRKIFLSDGGHIENLGVYELLKRGCALIVVIDAEADPTMSFPSLLKLERYARIDLGVRIVLPWEELAATAKAVNEELLAGNAKRRAGPHCAVGQIFYEDGTEGWLVYFKSSLTGDEKDYILDYKKRYPAFPHETTGDQFFSEEQFEVYRALGFHMVDRFFDGADKFSVTSQAPGAFAARVGAFTAVMNLLPAIW